MDITAEKGAVQRDGLAPKDDVKPVAKDAGRAEADLMIVGHLPFLSRLAARLLTGKESPQPVAFQKAGVVCLAREGDEPWKLTWMITPELL